MPVMRSMLRMLAPSASALTAKTCFSVGRVFAMSFLRFLLRDLLYTKTIRMQELSVYNKCFICYSWGMGKRTGRPKLSPENRKTEVFSVRFTPSELAKINAAATLAGEDPREWGR